MRSSDWSSDVCSSDLARRDEGHDSDHGGPGHGPCQRHLCGHLGRHQASSGPAVVAPKASPQQQSDAASAADQVRRQIAVAERLLRVKEAKDNLITFTDMTIPHPADPDDPQRPRRSEEHTSELQSLMRNPYAVFCLKNKK